MASKRKGTVKVQVLYLRAAIDADFGAKVRDNLPAYMNPTARMTVEQAQELHKNHPKAVDKI